VGLGGPVPIAVGARCRFAHRVPAIPVNAIVCGDLADAAPHSGGSAIRRRSFQFVINWSRSRSYSAGEIALGSTAMYQPRGDRVFHHHPSEHRMRLPAAKWARRVAGPLVCLLVLAAIPVAFAAERSFPDDGEFMLDAKPMKGSKRVPILEIESQDAASITLWCNRVHAQFVVVGDTITIILGAPTEPQYSTAEQCDPDRLRADDDLMAALQQVETWQRQDDVLILQGQQALRFRLSSH
jgi:heat shock protein HslJ